MILGIAVLWTLGIILMVVFDARRNKKVRAAMGPRYSVWKLTAACDDGRHDWCSGRLIGLRSVEPCICFCHEEKTNG